jgi:hypothetical protein
LTIYSENNNPTTEISLGYLSWKKPFEITITSPKNFFKKNLVHFSSPVHPTPKLYMSIYSNFQVSSSKFWKVTKFNKRERQIATPNFSQDTLRSHHHTRLYDFP